MATAARLIMAMELIQTVLILLLDGPQAMAHMAPPISAPHRTAATTDTLTLIGTPVAAVPLLATLLSMGREAVATTALTVAAQDITTTAMATIITTQAVTITMDTETRITMTMTMVMVTTVPTTGCPPKIEWVAIPGTAITTPITLTGDHPPQAAPVMLMGGHQPAAVLTTTTTTATTTMAITITTTTTVQDATQITTTVIGSMILLTLSFLILTALILDGHQLAAVITTEAITTAITTTTTTMATIQDVIPTTIAQLFLTIAPPDLTVITRLLTIAIRRIAEMTLGYLFSTTC